MAKVQDLSGQKFGRLTVISFSQVLNGKRYWLCKCECGTIKRVYTALLKNGHTKSCGCLQKEFLLSMITRHGKSRTPEYRAWKGLKKRCCNKNDSNYKNYGGRGITVCKRWINSFDNFLKDMGERPSNHHSLDREENDKGYNKKNCRWATVKQQANNKRNVAKSIVNGVKLNREEVCDYIGIGASSFYRFKEAGLSIEQMKQRMDLKQRLGITKYGRLPFPDNYPNQ